MKHLGVWHVSVNAITSFICRMFNQSQNVLLCCAVSQAARVSLRFKKVTENAHHHTNCLEVPADAHSLLVHKKLFIFTTNKEGPDVSLHIFGWLFSGLFCRFNGDGDYLWRREISCQVFISQNGCLLREIHVLHERHAAFQCQKTILDTESKREKEKGFI